MPSRMCARCPTPARWPVTRSCRRSSRRPPRPRAAPPPAAAATATPGAWTVADLAAKYNVNPLYAKGLSGAGRTIGIATLATYNQSDVFAYWNALGLAVDPARITDIYVDG